MRYEEMPDDMIEGLRKWAQEHWNKTFQSAVIMMEDDKEGPFLKGIEINPISKYTPNYGDDRMCKCGDPYYRHFDPFEEWANVGCKYSHSCGCTGFEEEVGELYELLVSVEPHSGHGVKAGERKTEKEWRQVFEKLSQGDCDKITTWFKKVDS